MKVQFTSSCSSLSSIHVEHFPSEGIQPEIPVGKTAVFGHFSMRPGFAVTGQTAYNCTTPSEPNEMNAIRILLLKLPSLPLVKPRTIAQGYQNTLPNNSAKFTNYHDLTGIAGMSPLMMKPAMPVSPYPYFPRTRGKGQSNRCASFTLNCGLTAIRSLFIAFAAVALSGCASTHAKNPADPLESFNRGVYKFNEAVDKAAAKPVAQGYSKVMPVPGQIMVENFFSNLDDVIVTINDLLQFKFSQAASDGSRFLFNSTFGVFGLFDVTPRLEKHYEDFGQTLGYWGIGSGPYVMLPILGPSTLRDSFGLYADTRPSILNNVNHMRTRNQMYLTKAISRRSQLLDEEKLWDEAAIDRYEFIRDAFLLRRQSRVYDGNPPREKYDTEEDDSEKQQVPVPNEHGELPPDNKTSHARFPLSNFPPQAGERANESLREFHINEPSARQDNAPAAIPANSDGAQPAIIPNAFEPQQALHPQPEVYKVWVAQRTAAR